MLTLKSGNYKVEDLNQLGRCVGQSLSWLYEANGCTSMGAHCPTCTSKTVCEDLNRLCKHIADKIYSSDLPFK